MNTRLIDQIADSPKRVRIMFRAALVVLLVAGCYNWVIWPQTSCLFAARQRQQWDAKLSDRQKLIRLSNQELKNKIGDLESQSEQRKKFLFEPDSVRQFFCGLETLAQESDCRIESLTFDKDQDKQSPDAIVHVVKASVAVLGNYNAFIRFFEQTGQCPQKISIQELHLEPLTPGKSTLRCNVVITAYVANKAAVPTESIKIP